MQSSLCRWSAVGIVVLMITGYTGAQTRPEAAVKSKEIIGIAGAMAFPDESLGWHHAIGASVRLYLSDRFAFQPRFVYARASKSDEDLLWIASLSYDLRSRNSRVIPYLIGGAGILNHHGRYRWRSGSTFGGGLGVKIRISEGFFLAPEIQLGWEPFLQIAGAGGRAF